MKYQVALLIGLLAMTLGHPMPDEENLEKSLENVPVALADQKQEIDSAPAEIVPELKSVIETEKLEATKPTEPMETPAEEDKSIDEDTIDEIIAEDKPLEGISEPIRAVRNAESEPDTTTPVAEKEESTTQAIVEGKKKDSDESKESNESKESIESKEDK